MKLRSRRARVKMRERALKKAFKEYRFSIDGGSTFHKTRHRRYILTLREADDPHQLSIFPPFPYDGEWSVFVKVPGRAFDNRNPSATFVDTENAVGQIVNWVTMIRFERRPLW